jgi:pyruvate/2-oxoglutarate dehydrogenase complex dihydrolipoamide dehydrogenase (E3) component
MTPLELGKGRGSLKNRGALTSLGFRARSGVTAPLQLASKVTIYSNENPIVTKEVSEALAKCNPGPNTARKVALDFRRITRFVNGSENTEARVVFEDGQKSTEVFIAHKSKGKLSGAWVLQLGLETTEQGGIKVNIPLNESSFARVFAVGDYASMMKAVPPL